MDTLKEETEIMEQPSGLWKTMSLLICILAQEKVMQVWLNTEVPALISNATFTHLGSNLNSLKFTLSIGIKAFLPYINLSFSKIRTCYQSRFFIADRPKDIEQIQ